MKKRMYKIMALAMTAAMVVPMAAQTTAFAADDKEITYWNIAVESPDKDILTAAVDKFNKETKSGYTVNQVAIQNDTYKEKLVIAMSSGECPDMYSSWSGGPMYEYIDSGFAQPIDDLLDQSDIKDKLLDAAIEQGSYNGHVYAIPYLNVSLAGIFYNKDMFEKAGITEVPTSLEGILAIGDDLKTKGGAGEPLALSIYGWYFEQWLCKQGLSYADNGNGRDAAATAVEFDSNGGALNILNEWKALNDADVAPNVGRAGSDTATTDFTSGKAAITLGSTASLKQILQDVNGSFEVGTAYFPTIKDGDEGGVSIGGASLWALNNNDPKKLRATWEFVKFLISPESQAYWNAQTGYFPVTVKAQEEQVFKDNVAKYPQFQTAIDQLHDSSADYVGALLSVFPEARATVESEIESMLNGKEDVDTAVKNMADSINKSIEEYNLVNE